MSELAGGADELRSAEAHNGCLETLRYGISAFVRDSLRGKNALAAKRQHVLESKAARSSS